jgi:two-component system alkaline phosphatase synthesis response regulator PhoP
MPLVLIVDDEIRIATIARDYLTRAGFDVAIASDGPGGLALAREAHPDLVVLDLGLPRLDGLEVARALRRESDVPIIMLTARVDERDRLRGFEVGADDYVTKPFSPRELVARVSSVLRRARHDPDRASVFTVADLSLDAAKLRVEQRGTPVDLTPTEFQLLACLARHPGRVFTRAQLLDAVRGTEIDSFERAIDAHVKNLRRKLERDPHRPRYLLTVYGIGYKFADA